MPRLGLSLCLLVVLLGACQSTESVGGGLDQAIADYEGGRLSSSYTTASELARTGRGETADQAAYVAGLAAYGMGRQQDAERYLLKSSRGDDAATAGKARAQLGLLRLDQNRPAEAAELFGQASGMLEGADASRAAQYAAASYEQAGNPDAARRWFATASRSASSRSVTPAESQSSAAPSTTSSSIGGYGGFALQVGAFEDRRRAERAAAEVMGVVERSGYGTIRITPKTDQRARQLYVVQFGSFRTRSEAATARARLGKLEYIVTPAS